LDGFIGNADLEVFYCKIIYTQYVLATFSNGLKLCENEVDVEATFYELFMNV